MLRRPPLPGERILVIGAGTIGLLVVLALAVRQSGAEIHVVARHPHQRQLALVFGAYRAYDGREGAAVAVQAATGAKLLRRVIGRPVFSGGFDLVLDCVGSRKSLSDALRVVRPGGAVTLVSTAGQVDVDWPSSGRTNSISTARSAMAKRCRAITPSPSP